MKIVLILSLCCAVPIYGQQSFSTKPRATDERYFFGLEQEYLNKVKCLTRIDAILKSKWNTDLEKISTKDLDIVESEPISSSASKPMYWTAQQEWLMESGSAGKQIESCIRGLIPEIVPLMNRAEISCVNSIFAKHIAEEAVHEAMFKRSLKRKARDQLPFRQFLSFGEFVEMMFQSRTPDALNDVERTTYDHAERYLTTEQDRIDPTWTIDQGCTWKNAVALRRAPNVEAKLNEFVRQVKDSYNRLLAHQLIKIWYGTNTLPRDKYLAWLRARDNMTPQINGEVDRLRNQKKGAQWLCERATELAKTLYEEQMGIFPNFTGNSFQDAIEFKSASVAQKTRNIERAMERTKDFRQPLLKSLAEKFEEGTRCLFSFVQLVQNHRRYHIALAFVDSEYNYAEFYCNNPDGHLHLVGTTFCKCVGSFCVHHYLAYLFADEYVLKEGPDGIYRVVSTGIKARNRAAGIFPTSKGLRGPEEAEEDYMPERAISQKKEEKEEVVEEEEREEEEEEFGSDILALLPPDIRGFYFQREHMQSHVQEEEAEEELGSDILAFLPPDIRGFHFQREHMQSHVQVPNFSQITTQILKKLKMRVL